MLTYPIILSHLRDQLSWVSAVDWALILSLIAFVFGIVQWRSNNLQSRRQLRAYLSASFEAWRDFRSDPKSAEDEEVTFALHVRNMGQTPAKQIELTWQIKPRPIILNRGSESMPITMTEQEALRKNGLKVAPLASGETREQKLKPIYIQHMSELRTPIVEYNGRPSELKSLCFYGRIKYVDVFEQVWETFFAWELRWEDQYRASVYTKQIKGHGEEISFSPRHPVFDLFKKFGTL